MELNVVNARGFNSSLKKAIKDISKKDVRVEIINSYNFPDCYVRVHCVDRVEGFSNELRLEIFDSFVGNRDGLIDKDNVSYGLIQKNVLSGKVKEWVKFFNNKN